MRPYSFWNLWKPSDRLWIGYGGVYYCSAHWNCSAPCSVCTSWHTKLFSGSHCWLTLTCQVCRSKVICGSQSFSKICVAGPVHSPVYGEWEVRFLVKNSSCSPCPVVLTAFIGFLQESQPLPFPLFHVKSLCIQQSTFFLLPVLLLAAFNKANGDLVVHLTSP